MHSPLCFKWPGADLKGHFVVVSWPLTFDLCNFIQKKWSRPIHKEFELDDMNKSGLLTNRDRAGVTIMSLGLAEAQKVTYQGKSDHSQRSRYPIAILFVKTSPIFAASSSPLSSSSARKNWPLGLNFSEAMRKKCTMKLYGSCKRGCHLLFL